MSDCASDMEAPLRFHIAGMGLFRRRELPEVNAFLVHLDLRSPSPVLPMKIDAEKSAGVVRHGTVNVLTVHRPTGLSKIAPAIVGPLSVDVVNLSFWPLAQKQNEGNPMALVRSPFKRNSSIPFAVYIPCDLAYRTATTRTLYPADVSGFWVVRKIFRKLGVAGRKIVSHFAVLSRGGQGRALLTQRFRPAFYARFLICSQQKGWLPA